MASPTTDAAEALRAIAGEIAVCTECRLAQGRTNAVPGEGAPDADVMFIGEGPGYYEDQQGRPFVGAAGKFLDELLASIGWARKDVYITNTVKCRPPDNRDPQNDELDTCESLYLRRQLELVNPTLLVTLGRFSLTRLFPRQSISRARGQLLYKDGLAVYPIYHPAAALHQQRLRDVIVDDFKNLPTALETARRRLTGTVADQQAAYSADDSGQNDSGGEQPSLF
ncbi:MAG: uracil-DNA glycosylase [Dehalococcoidia bacterium]|nr:uracil-DNA glycosylase [Dehalococcoidia bacterium]